jgi:hypothetical protein
VTTAFSYEHVFRAPSVRTVLEAYFDPDHLATQDKVAELGERVVTENVEDDKLRKTTWSVASLKPLPGYVKPFVTGGKLRYLETMTWRKADDAIDLVVAPQLAGGRVQIAAVYELAQVGEGQIRRRYAGNVSVGIPLVAGKIERGIIGEIEKGMPTMFACTQDWLERAR